MPRAYTFPKSNRLRSRDEFRAVFEARVKESRGPLSIYSRPNDMDHSRFGISMSRAVGNAVRRNRIKRLLREAFRHHQYDLPVGYDFVAVVRPHKPLILAEYQKLITALMVKLHNTWLERANKAN